MNNIKNGTAVAEELLTSVAGGTFNYIRAGEYLMILHHDEFVEQVPANLVAEFTGYYNNRRNGSIMAFIYEHAREYAVVMDALRYSIT